MKPLIASLLPLGLAALAVAGCGDGGGSQSGSTAAARHAAFGAAASPADRAAISRLTVNFLAAEANGNWKQACALLTKQVRAQVARLATQRRGLSGGGCPDILGSLFKTSPAQLQATDHGVSVQDARIEGARGYVFYSTPKAGSAYLPLEREGTSWKVATISGSSAP